MSLSWFQLVYGALQIFALVVTARFFWWGFKDPVAYTAWARDFSFGVGDIGTSIYVIVIFASVFTLFYHAFAGVFSWVPTTWLFKDESSLHATGGQMLGLLVSMPVVFAFFHAFDQLTKRSAKLKAMMNE